MLKLYCLPGRMLAHFNWLFPQTYIEAVQTDRQRDSTFIHFVTSTLFYGLVAWASLSLASNNNQRAASAAEAAPPADNEIDTPVIETKTTGPSDTVDRSDLRPPEALLETEGASSTSLDDETKADNPEIIRPTPDTSDRLAKAISKAAVDGKPARWRDGDDGGWAVPSESDRMGCRSVYYSIDTDNSGWHSQPLVICP